MSSARFVAALALAVPAACSHAQVPLERQGEPVVITDVGPIGSADDSPVFQAAADEAERRGGPLVLPAGATINLRGTVYLGDLTLRAQGSVINCRFDSGFQVRGKASLRTSGCIMTKSANLAGYGKPSVSIYFDSLVVNTIRSQEGGEPRIGLLLENTDHFVGQTLTVSTQWGGKGEATPLDFRRGVQGVRIDRIVGHMRNAKGPGGFWIRNDSTARATADIEIGSVEMDGSTSDELLGIFNSFTANADLHDIHIGNAILNPDGGTGQALAILRSVGDYELVRMKRISIDNVSVDVGRIGPNLSASPGMFAVKVQRVDARIGSISIRYSGPWTAQVPYVFGFRYAPGTGQSQRLHVPSVSVTVAARNQVPRGPAAMIWGPVVIDKLVVRGAGQGFRNVAVGASELRDVDAETGDGVVVPFANTARVHGSFNGWQVEK